MGVQCKMSFMPELKPGEELTHFGYKMTFLTFKPTVKFKKISADSSIA